MNSKLGNALAAKTKSTMQKGVERKQNKQNKIFIKFVFIYFDGSRERIL